MKGEADLQVPRSILWRSVWCVEWSEAAIISNGWRGAWTRGGCFGSPSCHLPSCPVMSPLTLGMFRYPVRFVTYLARFLLNYDKASRELWDSRARSIPLKFRRVYLH